MKAGAVGLAQVGDLGQRVDEAGVGGAGGGGDEQGARQLGEGFAEGGGVHRAGGGGDDDGVGQAEEPGGAGQGVVGVGAVDEPQAAVCASVCFPGEKEGELVGLGAAGGDERVRRAGFARQRPCHECLQFGGGGGLVPGVQGGVEDGDGEVRGGGDGEGRAVQVGGAQRVGGVRGALGEGPYEGVQGVVAALPGQYVADRVPHPSGHRLRPSGGQRPSLTSPPSRSASSTVSSNGRSAPGPSGPEARGGLLMGVLQWARGRVESKPVRRSGRRAREGQRSDPKGGTAVRRKRVGAAEVLVVLRAGRVDATR